MHGEGSQSLGYEKERGHEMHAGRRGEGEVSLGHDNLRDIGGWQDSR